MSQNLPFTKCLHPIKVKSLRGIQLVKWNQDLSLYVTESKSILKPYFKCISMSKNESRCKYRRKIKKSYIYMLFIRYYLLIFTFFLMKCNTKYSKVAIRGIAPITPVPPTARNRAVFHGALPQTPILLALPKRIKRLVFFIVCDRWWSLWWRLIRTN